MYGETFCKRDKAKAGRCKWSDFSNSPCCIELPSLSQPFRQSDKTSLRYCYAIQHSQQRDLLSIVSTHEREKGMDVCGSASQSKSRADYERIPGSNSSRIVAQQSKLVRHYMVGSGQYQRLGDSIARLAKRCIYALAKSVTRKKLSSPCGGLIEPPISPCGGQLNHAISPWRGLIRGCLDTFLSPYCGHLLVIPLYMLNSEWSWDE